MSDGTVYPGPLTLLIGIWTGDGCMGVAPKPDGTIEIPCMETITVAAVGDITNAKKQKLPVVRYHQVISRKADGEVFHDEIGYWIWDAERKTVAHSLQIPRAVALMAGGTFLGDSHADKVTLEVFSELGSPGRGIVESPCTRENASTRAFRHTVTVSRNKLDYKETAVLDIYGKSFNHADGNELISSAWQVRPVAPAVVDNVDRRVISSWLHRTA